MSICCTETTPPPLRVVVGEGLHLLLVLKSEGGNRGGGRPSGFEIKGNWSRASKSGATGVERYPLLLASKSRRGHGVERSTAQAWTPDTKFGTYQLWYHSVVHICHGI